MIDTGYDILQDYVSRRYSADTFVCEVEKSVMKRLIKIGAFVLIVLIVVGTAVLYGHLNRPEQRAMEDVITTAFTEGSDWLVRTVHVSDDMRRLYIHVEVRDAEVHQAYAEEIKTAFEGSFRRTFPEFIIFLDGTNIEREYEWVNRAQEWRVTNR